MLLLIAAGLLVPGINALAQDHDTDIARTVSVDELGWMAGCWAIVGRDVGSGEMWTPPAGGTMFGVSRLIRDGRTVAHEFILIREDAPGPVMVAYPSGQAETEFRLSSLEEGEAVFENPEHDFPQRVIYRSSDPGEMLGRIEGLRNGEMRGVDFPMIRTDCP